MEMGTLKTIPSAIAHLTTKQILTMAEAVLKESVRIMLVAGDTVDITGSDFIYYNNAGNVDSSGDSSAVFSQTVVSGAGGIETRTTSITIKSFKHIRSTSIQEDIAGTKGNTYTEDLSPVDEVRLRGILNHSNGSAYPFSIIFKYFPAAHAPNIDIARLRNVLRSSGNDYAGIFTNANINNFAPVKPNKSSPYSAGSLIGYAPNYVPVILEMDSGTVYVSGSTSTFKLVVPVYVGVGVSSLYALNSIRTSTPGMRNITMKLPRGSYTFNNYYIYDGVQYSLGTYTLIVSQLPSTIEAILHDIDKPAKTVLARIINTGLTSRSISILPTNSYSYINSDDNTPQRGELVGSIVTVTVPVGTTEVTVPYPVPDVYRYSLRSISIEVKDALTQDLLYETSITA